MDHYRVYLHRRRRGASDLHSWCSQQNLEQLSITQKPDIRGRLRFWQGHQFEADKPNHIRAERVQNLAGENNPNPRSANAFGECSFPSFGHYLPTACAVSESITEEI